MKPKFVCIGLNPAVDRTIEAPGFAPGGVVRGRLVALEPAGKATNVARSLAALGHGVTLTGLLGEGELDYFTQSLHGTTVETRFVPVSGVTRQNVTIVDPGPPATETHITEAGFGVGSSDIDRLVSELTGLVEPEACVVLSGSLPAGLTTRHFAEVLTACDSTGARLVIDTSGEPLRVATRHKPFLIKPNLEEGALLAGKPMGDLMDALSAADALLDNAETVLLSLGAEGAVGLASAEGGTMALHARDAKPPEVAHTVGAGDALLAGFLAGRAEGEEMAGALRLAVACGSACVGSRWASTRSRDEVARQLAHVSVTPVALPER